MTLSIAAWDQATGQLGAVISSSSISVSSRCLHWRPGTGIALSQNITDPRLGPRMLAALSAGVEAGGEAGPLHSAGMLIGGEPSWPLAELRIDWDDEPIAKMLAGWAVYEAQIDDYVTRAYNPEQAPSYGVPGDP